MASKAHVLHDYSFGSAHSRPRQLYYRREDPVELPRTSVWRAGGGALATAIAMGALVIGSVYAAFHEAPPPLMAETPALPPLENWQPDPNLSQAHVMNVLLGPALAVPDKPVALLGTDTAEDVPSTTSESTPTATSPSTSTSSELPSFESRAPESREVIIDDSKMYPPAATPAPYPNPTTTPPDAIAPPQTQPGATIPGPGLDPENPYRDGE